jgi:hypothetical protein
MKLAPNHEFIWSDRSPLRALAPASEVARGHTLPF